MEKEVKETKGQSWRKRLKQVGVTWKDGWTNRAGGEGVRQEDEEEGWVKEKDREQHCRKSQWVIVLGSCAQGEAVRAREKRKDREAQQGNKKDSSFPTNYTGQDFQSGSTCLWGFCLTCRTHTQKKTHGQSVAGSCSPPSSLHPTSSHSTKQNKFCLLNSRMWTPLLRSALPCSGSQQEKKKSSLDSKADSVGS